MVTMMAQVRGLQSTETLERISAWFCLQKQDHSRNQMTDCAILNGERHSDYL